ncbi:MAG: hypothetical protein AB1486_19255 [Planctomycetota bacterium]
MNAIALRSSALLLVAFLSSQASATTWIVDSSGGGDFREIQPAIDAAVDGDLILVRPLGSYSSFTIDGKGVTVRAFTEQFRLEFYYQQAIVVRNIRSGSKAGVVGMRALDAKVLVENCAGEVILENVYFVGTIWMRAVPQLEVRQAQNVSVTQMIVEPRDVVSTPFPAVQIVDSTVRLTHCNIVGQMPPQSPSYSYSGSEGGPGVFVSGSTLVVARSQVVGGKGGGGDYPYPNGGDGGDGIVAVDADVILLGSSSDTVRGGDGAPAPLFWGASGGDGGAGFSGHSALVSKVTLQGGAGGKGSGGHPDGNPGPDYEGTVTRLDVMPFLDTGSDYQPGEIITVNFTGVESGSLIWLISNLSGFIPSSNFIGPPLSAIPGRIFVTVGGGTIPRDATRSLVVPLPDHLLLEGFPLHFQTVVLGDDGNLYLGQAVSHVIGSNR